MVSLQTKLSETEKELMKARTDLTGKLNQDLCVTINKSFILSKHYKMYGTH